MLIGFGRAPPPAPTPAKSTLPENDARVAFASHQVHDNNADQTIMFGRWKAVNIKCQRQ